MLSIKLHFLFKATSRTSVRELLKPHRSSLPLLFQRLYSNNNLSFITSSESAFALPCNQTLFIKTLKNVPFKAHSSTILLANSLLKKQKESFSTSAIFSLNDRDDCYAKNIETRVNVPSIAEDYFKQLLASESDLFDLNDSALTKEEIILKKKLEFGEIPSLEDFQNAIDSCVASKNVNSLLVYFETLWELGLNTNTDYYRSLFGKLLEAGSYKPIFELLKGISERNEREGLDLSNWLFYSAVVNGEVALSKECHTFMFYQGFLRKNDTYLTFLRSLGIDRHEVIKHCLNPKQLKEVLREISRRGSVDEILNLIGLMIEMGLKLEAPYLNIALAPLIRHSPIMALKLLEVMKCSPETTPDFQTYFTIIRGLYVYHDSVDKGEELRKEMPDSLLPEDYEILIANVLLSSSFRFRPFEATAAFYQHILKNMKPNLVTFKKMARQLLKYSKAAQDPLYESNVDSIIEEITKRGLQPDTVLYSMLIKCYLKVNFTKAEMVFQEIIDSGLPLDRYVHSLFIHNVAKVRKDIPGAISWLERQIDSGIMPIQESVREVLGLIMRNADVESVEIVRKLLNRANYLPNLDDHIQKFIDQVNSGVPYFNPRSLRVKRLRQSPEPVVPVSISLKQIIPDDIE